jgi:fatty-acid desaturase
MSPGLRMKSRSELTNPVDGRVVWSPIKSIWYLTMLTLAIVLGPLTWSWDVSVLSCLLTIITLGAGHSVGYHRLLIHRSFQCPRWLEATLVTIGTLVGMGGPRRMLYLHDIRDWSQRHQDCHAFFIHKSSIVRDWWWNLNCEIKLTHPPEFQPESRVINFWYYKLLDQCWIAIQIPLAMILYVFGSWPWVVWGICVRVALSLTGHWMVGYLAHNVGRREWYLDGHAVQGFNVPGLGMITMGEAWHNNHHAFPDSARFGLKPGQFDPGWWLVCSLRFIGLVWSVQTPDDLPARPELSKLDAVEG